MMRFITSGNPLIRFCGEHLHKFTFKETAQHFQNHIQLNHTAATARLSHCRLTLELGQYAPIMPISKRNMGYYPGPKIPPKKPNFDYSGDIDVTLPDVDMNSPRFEYKECEELLSADDMTKKLVSLQYAPYAEVMKCRIEDIIRKVQKHELDFTSRAVKISKQTMEIRNGIRHSMDFPKDKVSKARLINKIQRRRKEIKFLRQEDYPLYEQLTEFLNIDYVPVYRHRKPNKRERRVNEVVEKAMALRQQKMEELRQALREERDAFIKEKDLLLSEIEHEMNVIQAEEEMLLDEEEEEEASTPLVKKPHVGDKIQESYS